MNRKHIAFVCTVLLLMTISCDEFLLKKTVSVQSLSGEIEFDPDDQKISGDIVYEIKNNQISPLTEIYFACHPLVEVNYITYNGSLVRFEQGLGYGYGIYRIRMSALDSGDKAEVGIEFTLNGPIERDRFVLTDEQVFFDAKEIWMPFPYADIPQFDYTLSIETPLDYYPVMGAEMISETTHNTRVCHWESESQKAAQTGNLFIGKLNRYEQNDLYYYSAEENGVETVFSIAEYTITNLSAKVQDYPYSEMHIISHIFQYLSMEEFIDGEFLANTVLIDPKLVSLSEGVALVDITNDNQPIIPENCEIKLFQVLSHELIHAYTSSILEFEEDNYLDGESFTEFVSEMMIQDVYPELRDRFAYQNRVILMNLYLLDQEKSRLWQYLYGLNTLLAAFRDSGNSVYNFLDILIRKYRYTEITREELYITSRGINNQIIRDNDGDSNLSNLIELECLALWDEFELYNLSLSYTNLPTNDYRYRNYHRTNKYVTLVNEFPIDVSAELISDDTTNVITNYAVIKANSVTNMLFGHLTRDFRIESHTKFLETDLSDNYLMFNEGEDTGLIYEQINLYYSDGSNENNLIQIPQDIDNVGIFINDSEWKSLYDDRAQFADSEVFFTPDNVYSQNDGMFYMTAFRNVNGEATSFVLFQIKILEDDSYIIEGVLDILNS